MDNKWVLAFNGITCKFPFKGMNGETFGGKFNTLNEAKLEFCRVLKYYYNPLKIPI
jgi:hypothetical protein